MGDAHGARFPFFGGGERAQGVGALSLLLRGCRVLDSIGILIAEASNNAGVTISEGSIALPSSGVYLIEVSSANNTPGDFLISVQPGAPLLPPEPLVLGELRNGRVDSEMTRQAYSFSASGTDVLLATVKSDGATSGVVVTLLDADTNKLFGLSSAQLGGVRYRILTGATNYLLEVTFPGGDEAQTYSVCLETESGLVTCGSESVPVQPTLPQNSPAPTVTPTSDPSGACMVQSAGAASINVRSGPGTGFSVVAQLPLASSAPVIGRMADNGWYQVNINSVIGWVSAGVVTLSGNCAGVGIAVPPPVPTSVSTQSSTNLVPTATPTPISDSQATTTTPTAVSDDVAPTATATPGGTAAPTTLPVFEAVDMRPDLTVNSISFLQVSDNFYRLRVAIFNIGASNVGAYTGRICINELCSDGSGGEW